MSEKSSPLGVKLFEREFVDLLVEEILADQVIIALLMLVQDGICFISKDLDVIYGNPAMRYWYEMEQNKSAHKCYELYHDRRTPCEDCPVLRSFETKKPEMGEQVYELYRKRKGLQKIFCAPVLDEKDNIIFCIEYIRDITDQERTELSLELMKNSLQTMKEYIEKKEREYLEKEQLLVSNMNKHYNMLTRYLKKTLDPDNYELVSRQLELSKLIIDIEPDSSVRFSEQELMIARFIADGLVSKEIASEMQISKKTVDYHRTNLRKKLQLGPEDNLRQALREYFVNNGI